MADRVVVADLDVFRGRDDMVHFKNKGTGHLAFKLNCAEGRLECKDRQFMVYIPISVLLAVLAHECNCTVTTQSPN